jgi:hypothetical protein
MQPYIYIYIGLISGIVSISRAPKYSQLFLTKKLNTNYGVTSSNYRQANANYGEINSNHGEINAN